MYCLQKLKPSTFGFAQKLINNGNSTKVASSSRLLLVVYHVKQNIMNFKFKEGDRVLYEGLIGVVSGVAINEYKKEAIILYENGMKTYALPNEEVEIMENDLTTI